MVAYHRHSKSRCEMKRLYVKPKYRENKLGKKLVLEILEYAKKAGYKEMVLDTIIPLQSAIHLYKKVGLLNVRRIIIIRWMMFCILKRYFKLLDNQ